MCAVYRSPWAGPHGPVRRSRSWNNRNGHLAVLRPEPSRPCETRGEPMTAGALAVRPEATNSAPRRPVSRPVSAIRPFRAIWGGIQIGPRALTGLTRALVGVPRIQKGYDAYQYRNHGGSGWRNPYVDFAASIGPHVDFARGFLQSSLDLCTILKGQSRTIKVDLHVSTLPCGSAMLSWRARLVERERRDGAPVAFCGHRAIVRTWATRTMPTSQRRWRPCRNA